MDRPTDAAAGVPAGPRGAAARALAAAREAYHRRDWRRALDGYAEAAGRAELTSDDLSASADAAWWLGLVEETLRAGEASYARFLDEKRPQAAANAAVGVAASLLLRGDVSAGSGWLGRAARLLADLPESTDHGYLRYLIEVEGGLEGPDLDAVAAAAREVQEVGRRHGDPTLVAIGVLGEGRALIRAGEITAGMAALDEAMVAVLADGLAPDWAGNIYCHLIAACYELADLRRAREWLAATERWLKTMPAAAVFTGVCRVHRSQFMAIRGEWEQAEQEANRVLREVGHIHLASAAEAQYTLGEIHRQRGNLTAAQAAYRIAHENGRDPQPGQALLLLAMGRVEAASASIRAAITAESHNRLARARLCAAQVEIATAAGDLATAGTACAELEGTAAHFETPGLRSAALHARGGLLLAEEQPAQALPVLRAACRSWHELDAPFDAARVRLLLARAYGALDDEEAAARELAAARATFDRLGAQGQPERTTPRRRADGLTEREVEVLVRVAKGDTNRQIATALAISEKTVARHLSNIFSKISASSRTEAAGYAYREGLTAGPDR